MRRPRPGEGAKKPEARYHPEGGGVDATGIEDRKAESTRTAGYGTVRPVVWEDGGDGGNPAYPIQHVRPQSFC